MKKRVFLLLAMVLSLWLVPGCHGCGAGYSEGDRVGTITKFSRKGLVNKSWEGEMNLGGLKQTDNKTTPNVWQFHTSDAMAPKIEEAMKKGEPVTLHYRQWAVSPMFTQDSDYDVTEVTAP